MNVKKSVLATMALLFLMVGCGEKSEVSEFNKPALYWYTKIEKSISRSNLDQADNFYISLKSEHLRSPLLPTAILMLAHAHMANEEYLLAQFYFDEYSKRFGQERNHEYIEFMKLKASFLGVRDAYKDQTLIMKTMQQAKRYLLRYPESEYRPLVHTILVRLEMSQYLLNENIASLYERTGKPDAAEIYREKNEDSMIEMLDIQAPKKGMLEKIFD
jgi:outer membrane protein assembly factor BamD